jgi:hypothetical protein
MGKALARRSGSREPILERGFPRAVVDKNCDNRD